MQTIVQEKVNQAISILDELEIDLWLTFVRETTAGGDPVLPLIYGHDLTWQTALILTRTGKSIAILGQLESETARSTGAYQEIIPYDESIRNLLLETLELQDPSQIALNYSKNDVHADGLTYGLYQLINNYLDGTHWLDRIISSERVIGALRGRKTIQEIERIKAAINTTEKIYDQTIAYAQPGMTELEISSYMHNLVSKGGIELAWELNHCPTINAGPDSAVGHVGPTNQKIYGGQILHFDFGVKQAGYCSDIQRVVYFLAPGEINPPEEVKRGFETVVNAIKSAVSAMKPGITGVEIDKVARDIILDAGYPEYKYGTGHHLGRTVHDGAGLLGPLWEKYGNTPNMPLEPGNVFTVEPGVMIPGFGYIGIEEDIVVTEEGAEFLSTPQMDLIIK